MGEIKVGSRVWIKVGRGKFQGTVEAIDESGEVHRATVKRDDGKITERAIVLCELIA